MRRFNISFDISSIGRECTFRSRKEFRSWLEGEFSFWRPLFDAKHSLAPGGESLNGLKNALTTSLEQLDSYEERIKTPDENSLSVLESLEKTVISTLIAIYSATYTCLVSTSGKANYVKGIFDVDNAVGCLLFGLFSELNKRPQMTNDQQIQASIAFSHYKFILPQQPSLDSGVIEQNKERIQHVLVGHEEAQEVFWSSPTGHFFKRVFIVNR